MKLGNKIRNIPVFLLFFVLSGCVSLNNIREDAGIVYDKALEQSELFVCNDASVGSVFRRYGGERWRQWLEFCGEILIKNAQKGPI